MVFLLLSSYVTAVSPNLKHLSEVIVFLIKDVTSPHVVDVHVGGAHSELADVFIKRISLKPHGTQEGDLGKLIVEHILPINDPHSCKTVHLSTIKT